MEIKVICILAIVQEQIQHKDCKAVWNLTLQSYACLCGYKANWIQPGWLLQTELGCNSAMYIGSGIRFGLYERFFSSSFMSYLLHAWVVNQTGMESTSRLLFNQLKCLPLVNGILEKDGSWKKVDSTLKQRRIVTDVTKFSHVVTQVLKAFPPSYFNVLPSNAFTLVTSLHSFGRHQKWDLRRWCLSCAVNSQQSHIANAVKAQVLLPTSSYCIASA